MQYRFRVISPAVLNLTHSFSVPTFRPNMKDTVPLRQLTLVQSWMPVLLVENLPAYVLPSDRAELSLWSITTAATDNETNAPFPPPAPRVTTRRLPCRLRNVKARGIQVPPRYILQHRRSTSGSNPSGAAAAAASNGKGKGKGKSAAAAQPDPFPGTTPSYANHMRMEIVRELKVREGLQPGPSAFFVVFFLRPRTEPFVFVALGLRPMMACARCPVW